MRDQSPSNRSGKRLPRPLDSRRFEELALSYVARFATSSGKLRDYLRRKLRERGWEGEGEPDVESLVTRYAELGYIDDEAWAKARSEGLLRRGYGARRVGQALHAAGIAETISEDLRPGEAERRRAALVLARKRRFGPFGKQLPERELREKQFAAMVRAGHSFDAARALVEADSVAAAERWVAEAEEDEE